MASVLGFFLATENTEASPLRCLCEDGRVGEKLCELRVRVGWPAQGIEKCLPLFWRSDKLSFVCKGVLCLNAGALENEVHDADTSNFRPRANQPFCLWVARALSLSIRFFLFRFNLHPSVNVVSMRTQAYRGDMITK